MSLWSFLRGLWPWRKRPQAAEPPPPPAPLAEPAPGLGEETAALLPPDEPLHGQAVEPAESPVEPAKAEPEGEPSEDDDEDAGWEDEEEDDDDPDAPDPFISGAPLEEESIDVDLAQRRAAARATALSGEQRIYLSMPAGPGSLAEALEQLADEGLVKGEFVGDGEGGPHILYRPT